MDTPALTTAKLIGLTGAAWLSGTITSLSLVSVPTILRCIEHDALPPTNGATLWHATFEAGFRLAPPIALATAGSLVFAGWTARNSPGRTAGGNATARALYSAAALMVGIVPFTILSMKGTNERLLGFAERALKGLSAEEGREVVGLLGKWMVLNAVRGVLPLVAAVMVGLVVVK